MKYRFRVWFWRMARTVFSEIGMRAERLSHKASIWTDKAQSKLDGLESVAR